MKDRDLRDFIKMAQEAGDLRRISPEVDWDLELSHIAKINEERRGPALLFENVKGYDIPVFSSILSTPKRLAMALMMPTDWSICQMAKEWVQRCQNQRIAPVEVQEAPFKENILKGEAVNLYRLPAPRFYEHDGGRYVGTFCTWVTRDPETGCVNLGTYRRQILDPRSAGSWVVRGKHAELHLRKYAARNEPMPVAVILGYDPLMILCSGAPLAFGESEYDLMGALRGFPVPVTRGEVVDLPVPANAEIVLEGYVWPGRLKPEGPFGEFTGYYSGGEREGIGPSPKEYIDVQCISHRNHPIYPICSVGRPVTDDHMIVSLFRTSSLWLDLDAMKIPGIQSVYIPPESCGSFIAIVSVKQMYPGHSRQVGNAVLASNCGTYAVKMVIVVDEDIPADDLDKVLWALSVRYQPDRSTDVLRGQRSNPLDPSLHVDARDVTSKIILDATIPFDWKEKPRVASLSPQVVERVLGRWKEYGLEDISPKR